MNRRLVLTLFLLSLMISGVVVVAVQPIKATYETITVPDDYPSIQQAIDNAIAGDVILVRNGTYYENITVNKRLSLIGLNGTQRPVIDGGGAAIIVKISADGVLLKGFNVTNSSSYDSYGDSHLGGGIQIFGANECIIANNTACNNLACGISLVNANNNTVTNNTCAKNEVGIRLWSWSPQTTNYNVIDNNTCSENLKSGIATWSYVFKTWTTSYNNITNNFVSQNGIQPFYGEGIYIGKSDGDIVSGNTIFSNYEGLTIDSSVNCRIFHNDFIINNQPVNIRDTAGRDSVNQLDDDYPSGGNYYSDYNGTDSQSGPNQNITGSDGIGDTPQVFNSNNQDCYPLMTKCGTFEPTYIQVNFTDSFRDNSGAALYTKPSAFQLLLPNGTVSPSLELGTCTIHTGTTRLLSVVWQGTDVTPDTTVTFDAADGDPTVNCRIYQLTVNPIFYNMSFNQTDNSTSYTILTPSSWSMSFPNGTIGTFYSNATLSQTQTGNYEIHNAVLQNENITFPPATLWLTSNTEWSPSLVFFEAAGNQTFGFDSNSTITQPDFNATSQVLSFTVAGASGTSGYVKIIFAKNLTDNPEDIVVRQDGNPIEYSITSMGDSNLLAINYTHSTHSIEIDFASIIPESIQLPILLVLMLFTLFVTVFLKHKKIGFSQTRACYIIRASRTTCHS